MCVACSRTSRMKSTDRIVYILYDCSFLWRRDVCSFAITILYHKFFEVRNDMICSSQLRTNDNFVWFQLCIRLVASFDIIYHLNDVHSIYSVHCRLSYRPESCARWTTSWRTCSRLNFCSRSQSWGTAVLPWCQVTCIVTVICDMAHYLYRRDTFPHTISMQIFEGFWNKIVYLPVRVSSFHFSNSNSQPLELSKKIENATSGTNIEMFNRSRRKRQSKFIFIRNFRKRKMLNESFLKKSPTKNNRNPRQTYEPEKGLI